MNTTHAENFTLEHHLTAASGPFAERFTGFRPFVDRVRGMGFVLREITGPAGPVVTVRDEFSAGAGRDVIMLGSNNYLGLADEPQIIDATVEAVRRYGIGCGGPPLLNGTTSLHRELEERLAAFKNAESAMIFSSGYAANLGWLTGLMRRGDVLVYDEQSHASVVDAIRLGRIRSVPFEHNNIEDLAARLSQVDARADHHNVVVAVEGVYSMDGDLAALPEISALCRAHGAWLALDDAHATGVLGATGRGSGEHFEMTDRIDLTMGSLSKVLATTGGFVCGSADLVDTLRFFARSYMFSASLATPVVAAAIAGIDFIEAHPERPRRLRANTERLVRGLRSEGFDVRTDAAIVPVAVPAGVVVADVVAELYREGVFVNGVEYPAVPSDRGRLRLSVMATHTEDHIDTAVATIAAVARRHGFHPDQRRQTPC